MKERLFPKPQIDFISSVLSCFWKSPVSSVSVFNVASIFLSFMLKKMSVGGNQVLH